MTKVTKQMEKKFKALYREGNSSTKIAKTFNLGSNTILRHLRKTGTKIKKPHEPQPIRKSSSKLTKYKAYVLGVLGPGDGYVFINKNKGDYIIGLQAIEKKFVDFFALCLRKTYGISPRRGMAYHKKRNTLPLFVATLHSKLGVEDLLNYNVSFKEKIWRVPSQIKNASPLIKSIYIKGMADSQGSVDYKATRSVRLAAKNREGLEEIGRILTSLGILDYSIDDRRLTITSRRSLENFSNKINFTIDYKYQRLKRLLKIYKFYGTTRREMQLLIPKMIILRTKGFSYNKIAEKLNLSHQAVKENLNKINGELIG